MIKGMVEAMSVILMAMFTKGSLLMGKLTGKAITPGRQVMKSMMDSGDEASDMATECGRETIRIL
jgi:hypothetical protein